MDIRDLESFLIIAEEGNITGAAKRLNIAQPPLSRQLKLLEEELGLKLFHRGSRRVKLTEAGQLLRNRAEQIIELINNTKKELKDLNKGIHGTLSIGTCVSFGVTLLPLLLQQFHEQFPEVTFQLWEGSNARIRELVDNGVAEIGIVRSVFDPDIYESIELPMQPFVAALHPKHHLSDDTSPIRLADLAAFPLTIYRPMEERIIKYCKLAGFKPNIICICDDIRSLLVLANTGIGVAIVPHSSIKLVPADNLAFRLITEPSILLHETVIWLKHRHLSAVGRNFLNFFKNRTSELQVKTE